MYVSYHLFLLEEMVRLNFTPYKTSAPKTLKANLVHTMDFVP